MSGRRIQARFQRLVSNLLNPALCLGCAHELELGQHFCATCISQLSLLNNPCALCGLENQTGGSHCAACLYDPPRWQNLVAPLIYQGLARDLLIQLKFAQSLHLANSLVSSVIHHFRMSKSPPQVLLPVPLHRKRLLDRGFNQAFEIARALSHLLDIPVDTRALRRVRYTDSQSGLSANQRQKNILKAFAYESSKSYSHVAVVDDIVTTGSTANEITKTLHRAGVQHVSIWGLARVSKY
jgi:ComF family protein